MRFHFDFADRKMVDGWVLPDNPSATPQFRIQTSGGTDINVSANLYRPDIHQANLHETGMVGFRFDTYTVPDFEDSDEIIITELSCNRVIYRRNSPFNCINQKIFIFNNIPVPSPKFNSPFSRQFLISYPRIDEFGIETALSYFGNVSSQSIFIEGRLALQGNLRQISSWGFKTSALLTEPFSELANRILVVKTITSTERGRAAIQRLSPYYRALAELVPKLGDFSAKDLSRGFSNLDASERNAIYDPMTRLLGCSPSEEPEARHVSSALNLLSQMSVVGTTSTLDTYLNALAVEVPNLSIDGVVVPEIADAHELEEQLRSCMPVSRLLRNDERLFDYVKNAIDHVMTADE